MGSFSPACWDTACSLRGVEVREEWGPSRRYGRGMPCDWAPQEPRDQVAPSIQTPCPGPAHCRRPSKLRQFQRLGDRAKPLDALVGDASRHDFRLAIGWHGAGDEPGPTSRLDPVFRESRLSADGTGRDGSIDEADRRLSEWMQAAQAGDADRYRELLSHIEPKIRSIVRRKIREEAAVDDVVQNVLLSIHRGRRTYRAERPFGPWMRAIVRNSVIDHFRDRKRKGDREVELIAEEWADEFSSSAEHDVTLAPELVAALAALPEGQREAVMLIQAEGLSVAEAALRTGISAGALKVRAHRGYRALRKALEGAREGGEWKSSVPPSAEASISTSTPESGGTG